MTRFRHILHTLVPTLLLALLPCGVLGHQPEPPEQSATPTTHDTRISPIAPGWAGTSINAVVFRRNSIASHDGRQVVAFYDQQGRVVLAERVLDTTDEGEPAAWNLHTTQYSGNIRDAHNAISIMLDGEGVLHMSWDHHGHPLRYCRSVAPGSLELTDMLPMTGSRERSVTYPEFYRTPGGDLVFFYRDGGSGRGDLVMNHYDTTTRTWTQRQTNLIDGEGERNAYWQACVDPRGSIHLSWVWRETGDVATNHDLCYARSDDVGLTWHKTTGEAYDLPIREANAEYAARIPQQSDLINTTSMCANEDGLPAIATYWRPADQDVPQFHVVHHDGRRWHTTQASRRSTPFRLAGHGTRRIPISRCQVLTRTLDDGARTLSLVYRDAERGSVVTLATCTGFPAGQWALTDLTDTSVGGWEPSYDTERWRTSGVLNLFLQHVGQGDGEGTEDIKPQMVSVLEWDPASDVHAPHTPE